MRLHRLEVTAFGPFAQRQEVDFDRLSEAGLFLLHGPTGAGKTSVLDAICFALYGRVPGVRGSAGRLRSDHAPADLAPEVVCDFTVSGRRFEVTRSPDWLRPKRRGAGVIREQAHVVLKEWVGGEWLARTNRIDEAADLLDQVIGLGAEQFTKLILLPQGDFAAFLRASAEERRPLLQKLFGTDRFAEVERWLADRRREFEHQIQAAAGTTARLFARAEEARLDLGDSDRGNLDPGSLDPRDPELGDPELGDPELGDPELGDPELGDSELGDGAVPLDRVPEPESATALVIGWAESARTELRAAHAEVNLAEKRYESARQAADEATEVVRRHERQTELEAELSELRAAGAEQERIRAALVAASHASVLAPLLAELDRAERQLARAQQRWSAAYSALQLDASAGAVASAEAGVGTGAEADTEPGADADIGPGAAATPRASTAATPRASTAATPRASTAATPRASAAASAEANAAADMAAKAAAGAAEQAEVTAERVSRLREELGSLTELLRAEADLGRLDVRRADDEQQIAVAERIRAEAEATLAELTAREIELTAARNAAELLAVTLADREQDSVRATTIAKAVLEQQRLTDEQTAADDGLRTAIDVHQAAVAASQELRARRLDGMAAELAAGLGPDSQCPVCGSAEHPAPAAHHTAPVTELAQQQAEATEAAALAERELAQQAVNTAAQRLAAVRAVTEGADAETASAALIEAQRRVLEARAAAGQAGQLGAELDAVDTAQELALDQQQAARARAAAGRESLAEIEGRRSDLRERLDRARGADADVATRYGRLERTAAVLAECLTAKQAVDEASERLRRAQSAADEAAAAAGFEGRAAAGRALLPEPERERQTARLAEYDHRKARVEALLAELQAEAEAEIEAAAQPTTSKLEPTQVADTAQVGEAVQGAEAMQGVREPGVREPGVRKPGVRKPGVRKPGVREQVVEDEVSEPLQLDLFAQFFGLTEHAVVAAEAPPDPAPAPAPAPDPQPEPQPSAGPEPLPDAQPSAEPEPLPDAQPSAESKPLPDLEALHLAQSQAREAHELARERHTLASRAVRALSGLAGELQRHASATAPLRRQFAALDSVSRCVEGTGGDNALRMRLSSYVLAARLEQVAAAASIRLAAMSGGRYLLVHTDGPARGGARSGLGLAVIDGWTGVQRDPASLSGGETFCTSLALALGLADVVQAEAGGSVIETLLVDEGFGSLDEQTLDEVMDVLDGLRSAGRSVGLVSHVGDLRDRIPAQLQVLKTRTGSQLVA